ncbi:DUF6083 domain-containing protein [Streptomyces sp. CB03234]|uniref:DUF6083 domain-containing protein n=1 Tax=Streptomyces sp. (strain CB03234) TaxID=1703937 RepID=UPI001F527A4B|nr:DUF6083 domain-containing protein [Streptomyces sp. CB03234]
MTTPVSPASPVCAACETPGARWSAPLGMPLCAACTTAATGTPDRDPVRLGDILPVTAATLRASIPAPRPPRTGSLMTCRLCGAEARWHRTVHGRWVAIEPGERPTAGVPRGERWYVAGDGTAVQLRGAAPSDTCRVSHFSVCAGR